MTNEKVFQMKLKKIYPLLVAKAEKKGRTRSEVDQVTCWLTVVQSGRVEPFGGKRHHLRRFLPKCPCSQPKPEVDHRIHLRSKGRDH